MYLALKCQPLRRHNVRGGLDVGCLLATRDKGRYKSRSHVAAYFGLRLFFLLIIDDKLREMTSVNVLMVKPNQF